MNRQEKLISLLLGLILAGWLWHSVSTQTKAAEAAREAAQVALTNVVREAAAAVQPAAAPVTPAVPEAKPAPRAAYEKGERLVTLSNGVETVLLSTHGATVKRVTLARFAERPGDLSADNPAVALDFAAAPALEIAGAGDFEVAERGDDYVLFRNARMTRRITLKPGYRLAVEETFADEKTGGTDLALGRMATGAGKNDSLGIDSMVARNAKGKREVEHHDETDPLKAVLIAGGVGGCSGAKSAEGIPETTVAEIPGARTWIALKNRFFATAVCEMSVPNAGFRAAVTRDLAKPTFVPLDVRAELRFPGSAAKRAYTFYAGPKQQTLLWDLGAEKGSLFGTGGLKDVMEYGMWRWVCYPLVAVLNFFYGLVPNYGMAIILLTILVRLLFWPLTHKSTISMRRMGEIQPLMKEIREKYKDNPQRMQQETFALYREHKVNPMASCLPMLVQIPVFIALFNVLRACVELRYAPFLWIADLSEPEALGATSWFPFFGGLNILPILMAATMALQSALTPSTGDRNQQRMMIVMMPAMMLFMFYSFPSALSLYWTVSQVLSIAQMWYIRKRYPPKTV